METNNIIAAPQIQNINKVYEIWQRSHYGNITVFYEFMTTPTVERDQFIESVDGIVSAEFDGPIFKTTLR